MVSPCFWVLLSESTFSLSHLSGLEAGDTLHVYLGTAQQSLVSVRTTIESP